MSEKSRAFSLYYDPSSQALVCLASFAAQIALQESSATSVVAPATMDRLSYLLSMSLPRSLPLRVIFWMWKKLGLLDDIEGSIIVRNSTIFSLRDNPREPNTHPLELTKENPNPNFTPMVEEWRHQEMTREGSKGDEMELRFGFKYEFSLKMQLMRRRGLEGGQLGVEPAVEQEEKSDSAADNV